MSVDRERWQDSAACRGSVPSRRLCCHCPVRADCLRAGLQWHPGLGVEVGLYGGLDEDERLRLLKRSRYDVDRAMDVAYDRGAEDKQRARAKVSV